MGLSTHSPIHHLAHQCHDRWQAQQGHLSHLEVHKFLQCGGELVYPEGLNGSLEPLWVSLPKPPIWDLDPHVESSHKPTLLQVNLPRITHGGKLSITSQWFTMPISSPHSVMECPSDMVPYPSMTMEIEELLSCAMFNTSGQLPIGIYPRRPTSMTPDVPTASGGNPLQARKDRSGFPKGNASFPTGVITSRQANGMAHTSCSPSLSPMPESPEGTSVPSTLQS